MYYLGQDRARRQQIGLARSADGVVWHKLRSNPVLAMGEPGGMDDRGLGEPAVWQSQGWYWMLFTGRDANENRSLGLARSVDGVKWTRSSEIFHGAGAWDNKVVCDPTVLVQDGKVRVWFGGGDVASPDQNLHGQIGIGVLR
jgi:sucrose-6-phosphate hydrolase SacC (GH32 family)